MFKWFLYQAGLYEQATEYVSEAQGLNVHSYEQDVLRKAPGYRKGIAKHLEAGKPVVNFLRCPYQRAFSSYMHLSNRFFISQVRGGISSPGLKVREDVVEFVYGPGASIEYPVSFLDYLEWLASGDNEVIDPHHRPQHSEIFNYRDMKHYRLEDFHHAIGELEREFGLRSSQNKKSEFSAGHHLNKVIVPRRCALRLLEKSIPLNPSELFRVPTVSRQLLDGTRFDEIIRIVFAQDLALYDTL